MFVRILAVASLLLIFEDSYAQRDAILNFRDSVVDRNLKLEYRSINRVIRDIDSDGYRSHVTGYIFPVRINGDADFSYTHFTNDIDFSLIHFYNKSVFEESYFDSFVSFSDVVYEKDAIFSRATFNKEVNLYDSHFIGDANFLETKFNQIAYFASSRFGGEARFSYAFFGGEANFTHVNFNKDVSFVQTRFYKKADFSYLNINDSARITFYDAQLPDTLCFCNVQNVHNEIDLLAINFKDTSRYDSINDSYREGKWHYISLYKSNVSKFHLDYSHFRLLLLDNMGHTLPVDEANTVFESLLDNFKDRGQMESYELLDIEYQDYKWKNKVYFSFFGRFLHFWNAYGHKPELPLLWTLCLIAFFTVITFIWLPFLHTNVYAIDMLSSFRNIKVALSYRYFFRRLWYSFIYTSLIFFPLSLKVDKIKVDRKLATLYIMLVYAVGLLCLGYVANFILQK